MGAPDRRLGWEKIKRVLTERGPMIMSEIANATHMNHEACTYAVYTMVRIGDLIVLDELRPTRTGMAKQYDVARAADRGQVVIDWVSRARRDQKAEQLVHALDRWGDWCRRGMPPLGTQDPDRMLYWAIEAGMKVMPTTMALAVAHVHCHSVWVFRRLDMEDAYRDALGRLRARLEPLFGLPPAVSAGQPTEGESREQEKAG